MSNTYKKDRILIYKILFTVCVILIYMVGRNIPLYGINTAAYETLHLDAESIFEQTLTGDFQNCSLFILGMWPYMLASIFVMVYMAFKSMDKSSRISSKRMNAITAEVTLVIGLFQAFQRAKSFQYTVTSEMLWLAQVIVIVEMIAGMMIVIWLCDLNTKYGVGSRMGVFLVNIVIGMQGMITSLPIEELKLPIIIGLVEIPVMIFMETTEKRIPVQRVSIHNIYADKNYISYKLNIIGVMPLMFASAFFMLPRLVLGLLAQYFPENDNIIWATQNMSLSRPLGVVSYIVIIWILEITFAFLMINPRNMAESLLKSGDSILDVYAGKTTRNYLTKTVLRFSIYSALFMSICMGVPLCLQFNGMIHPSVAMLPSSLMMSTGLWIMLYREAVVYKNMENYRPFV